MIEDTQKYSNSTVYIVIAFLAIFIIMPPLCRTLYAEEEVLEEQQPQEEVLADGKLICSKAYPATGVTISSTASYEEGVINSNVITFKNPNGLLLSDGLDEDASNEFNEYSSLINLITSIPDSNKMIVGDTITITIDDSVIEILGENQEISNLYQDALTLQNAYEISGYSCTME